MQTTHAVALGVQDVDQAVAYYKEVLGFQETSRDSDWVELSSGALTFYVCPNDGRGPCFNLLVDDLLGAEARLVAAGGEVYLRQGGEVFVQDRFGHCFCLSSISRY